MTLGPVLGGVLAAAGGTDVALLMNAATFAVVAGARETLAVAGGLPALAALAGLAYFYRRAWGEVAGLPGPSRPAVEEAAPVSVPGAAE